ncbi:PASTA domain containing protein [Methanobacterium lacus]|uniref:PASTA domain containing protein n=1 Tax=Methanobacterium lacus (strain AL-21) TaxID=877455 RepID=F0T625_METLA|nr:PASTA domain-containing protein [Methanobacterium lacus]ADZ10532.1 PASTA domain containing protein [Methanobacterium lacus]
MSDEKELTKFLGSSVLIILISLLISYIIPQSLTNQSAIYWLICIIIICLVMVTFLLLFKWYFNTSMKAFILILSIFIVFTIAFSYYFYSNDFATTPNLISKSSGDAENLLNKTGLTYNVTYKIVNNSSYVNTVLSQNPKDNVLVHKNSMINIVVGQLESIIFINQPQNHDYVEQNITVSGKVKNLQNGDKVYLLVQPQPISGDGPYEWYIQPTPTHPISVDVQTDGTWKCNAYLGSQGDIGRQFKIVAIVTNLDYSNNKVGFDLPNYKSISNIIYVTRSS